MNRFDRAQIVLSLVVMLIGLYIALSGHSRREVHTTTRVASFGVALLGLSYLVGGLEDPTVEGPLLDRAKRTRRWWGFWWFLGR